MNRSENQKPDARPTPEPGPGLEKPSRRRLLRGGLVAAPAVLALKSTPVLACNCKLPSGFSVSGNLSHGGAKNCTQPTSTPSGWSGRCSGSPLCYNSTNWRTTDHFGGASGGGTKGCGLVTNGTYGNHPLATCLNLGDSHPQALATACYLEGWRSGSLDGSTGFPHYSTIAAVWNGYCAGSYSPTAGVTWNQTQIHNYLLYLTGQAT
ncbi:MAG: hypothetical protein JO224_01330 [Pelomonas sp.]|nr:hypothetical protein [Roseateles sp.]